MKRPKRFLSLILILLVINTGFFIAWYGFDLQGKVKRIIENEIGQALGGKLNIGSFAIGERQLLARNIVYSANDSTIKINSAEVRINYNLFKFLFSGFKIRNLLDIIEISDMELFVDINPKPDTKKLNNKSYSIPDITKYFNKLSLSNGTININYATKLTLASSDTLLISESISNINLTINNNQNSIIKLEALSSSEGRINTDAILDNGRIESAVIELKNVSPKFISHKDIQGVNTEINLDLSIRQEYPRAPLDVDGIVDLYGSSATIMDKYQVQIPKIRFEGDERLIKSSITGALFGTSTLTGEIQLRNITKQAEIDGNILLPTIDLGMLNENINGFAEASIQITGLLTDIKAQIEAHSEEIKIFGQNLTDISASAMYDNNYIEYVVKNAVWNNQRIITEGKLDTSSLFIAGYIDTEPLQPYAQEIVASGRIDYESWLGQGTPIVNLALHNFDLMYRLYSFNDVNANLALIPYIDAYRNALYLDASLQSSDGYRIDIAGDLKQKQLICQAEFSDTNLANIYGIKLFTDTNPTLSGTFKANLDNDEISFYSDVYLASSGFIDFSSNLSLIGSYNTSSMDSKLLVSNSAGKLNGEDVQVEIAATIQDKYLDLLSLGINDKISLSGGLNLKEIEDFKFDLKLNEISSEYLSSYNESLSSIIPMFSGLNLRLSYNWNQPEIIDGNVYLEEVLLDGLYPMSAELAIHGIPSDCRATGNIRTKYKELVSLLAEICIGNETHLTSTFRANDLKPSDLVYSPPFEGSLTGIVKLDYTNISRMLKPPLISTDIQINDFKWDQVELDIIDLVAVQKDEQLLIDTLYASKEGLINLVSSGSLGYNVLSDSYFESNDILNVSISGQLFKWLRSKVPYFTEARGQSDLDCNINIREDQFNIVDGNLEIKNGFLRLADQTEPITGINIKGFFDNNMFKLNNATAYMGQGKARIQNRFNDDMSNHFQAGFIDLGVFEVRIDEPGVMINLPLFTPSRTLTNVVLRGQDNEPFATVMGPFDDMKIKGHAYVSNSSAVYPPNTDNLLRLINTVRDVAFKKESEVPPPLPFILDLKITLQDNVNYVTYPTNFTVNNGSNLQVVYDGQIWRLPEAQFASEKGSIDFFGTVFEVQQLNVNILEAQDLVDISGTFVKRAPDGTLITLTVVTNRDASKSILNRLEFNLSSDNPQDRTITHILSRLRYNQSVDDLSEAQKQNLLSDEAINLISGNINTSLISPILYPVENSIRRFFKLDAFTINVGFIQNLVTEYSSDQENLASYTDLKQLSTDILQFSSSILLNNLSFSMSKYLGAKLFLDYQLKLQEATDLQKNTVLLISHDTSLRMMLPYKLRLSYNLKYEPLDNNLIHGVMLQRSFRFRGF